MERLGNELSDFATGLSSLSELLCSNNSTLSDKLERWSQKSGWQGSAIFTKSGQLLSTGKLHGQFSTSDGKEMQEVLESFDSQHNKSGLKIGKYPTAPVIFSGRCRALLFVETDRSESWREVEQSYLQLSADLIGRTTAFESWTTNCEIDATRLDRRLNDSARFAARMAHDFDNVLTGIIGFADLLRSQVAENSESQFFTQEIAAAGQRGTAFTRQLHQFSRAGQARPQPGSVASTFAKEVQRVRPGIPSGVTLTSNVPANLPCAAMDTATLQIVVGHLLDNAVESGAGVRSVHATASLVVLDHDAASHYLGRAEAGNAVEITVSDDGPGISADNRTKLFHEPFFTTKVRHRGLGLATVFRILFAHRGGVRIDAAPAPGSGTIARVIVPIAAAPATVKP